MTLTPNYPPTNQFQEHCELIMQSTTYVLYSVFKIFSLKVFGETFEALAVWSPCLVLYNECCTFLHHNVMSVD